MSADGKRLIQVCGDPTVDWMSVRTKFAAAAGRTYFFPPQAPNVELRLGSQPGGSALLTDLIKGMVRRQGAVVDGVTLAPRLLSQPMDDGITSAWTVWDVYSEEPNIGALRLAEWRECEAGQWDYAGNAGTGSPDLLAIEDSGLGFRDHDEGWPEALARGRRPRPAAIILKIAQYADADSNPLLAQIRRLRLAGRTTVVTSINDLRACPVKVASSLSWERMLEDVTEAVRSEGTPFFRDGKCVFPRVIVTIEASGAVIVEPKASFLVFDRRGQEGDFNRRREGEMMGYNTCVVGALVAAWTRAAGPMDWRQATVDGLGLARLLHLRGYEAVQDRNLHTSHLKFPSGMLAKAYSDALACRETQVKLPDDHRVAWDLGSFGDAADAAQGEDGRGSCRILERTLTGGHSRSTDIRVSRGTDAIYECARRIVSVGPKEALPDVPVEMVGKWQSADRDEIEGVRCVMNAFKGYLDGKRQDTPLSVAVFGPPGSGKSFVVRQIAEGLGMDSEAQLTFNLSQLQSPGELAKAFHQIRDLHLAGKTPLVFWDEFDTPLGDTPLGWLRYFLAPMQDGEFHEDGVMHPTGGGIYVFAGATRHSFSAFCEGDSDSERAAKKPDFVSRLRAYIDVKGINGDPNSVQDALYPVRRAFLLHSLLGRIAPHLARDGKYRLDSGVVDAFLKTTRYTHGARSMQAILGMSALAGKRKFELSSLPPETMLQMHVNTAEFTAFSRLGARDMLRVGITGHIGLDPDRMDLLNAGVEKAVQFIKDSYPDRYITALSPLAVGADRIVARVVLKDEATRLIGVLPVPRDDYVDDFGPTDSHADDYEGAELRQEFDHWLDHRAVEIINMEPVATRDEAYLVAGEFIAKHCDVMVAVWDGEMAQGLGGTGDIVRVVLKAGKPLFHVWAGNWKKDPQKQTDVGERHGMTRHVNFEQPKGEWLGECVE